MKKIVKLFKHIFIPHEGNEYQPHFFRDASVFTICLVVLLLLAISWGTKIYIEKNNMIATVLPAVLVDLTNDARIADNKLALAKSPLLERAAKLKAEDMATFQYFAHTSPRGITPWYWFGQAGYTFIYAGENLAVDFTESKDVENAWLASPTHKKNILNSNFTEIGIATTEGFFNGRPTTFVVQMFGKPAFPFPVKPEDSLVAKADTVILPQEEKIVENKITTNPVVKGESAGIEKELETLINTEEFISVKNTEATESTAENIPIQTPKYSSWYQRFLFMMPSYANTIYCILIWLVAVALFLMTVIEIKKQHSVNIMYGILILVILICFIYINRTVFLIDLFR